MKATYCKATYHQQMAVVDRLQATVLFYLFIQISAELVITNHCSLSP